jgi:putative transposase
MALYGLKCGDFMRQFWRFYESNDKKLGKQALKEVATIVKPDTILGWHRKLVA